MDARTEHCRTWGRLHADAGFYACLVETIKAQVIVFKRLDYRSPRPEGYHRALVPPHFFIVKFGWAKPSSSARAGFASRFNYRLRGDGKPLQARSGSVQVICLPLDVEESAFAEACDRTLRGAHSSDIYSTVKLLQRRFSTTICAGEAFWTLARRGFQDS